MSIRMWSLFAVISLLGCGNPANPPDPKWTVENPSASASKPEAASGVKSAAVSKTGGSTGGSLDDLQRGGSSAAASGPLKDVYFGYDRFDLSSDARAILKANADWLKANPSARVQIEGHCDERGTVEYNLALGSKRAQSTKDYLETLGIAAARLSVISYGEEIPVCRESTESCWEKNRRARFVVTGGLPTT